MKSVCSAIALAAAMLVLAAATAGARPSLVELREGESIQLVITTVLPAGTCGIAPGFPRTPRTLTFTPGSVTVTREDAATVEFPIGYYEARRIDAFLSLARVSYKPDDGYIIYQITHRSPGRAVKEKTLHGRLRLTPQNSKSLLDPAVYFPLAITHAQDAAPVAPAVTPAPTPAKTGTASEATAPEVAAHP